MIDLEEQEIDAKSIASLTRAVSQLSRADVNFRLKMDEIKRKARKAAAETKKVLKSGGWSDTEVENTIGKILGIIDE